MQSILSPFARILEKSVPVYLEQVELLKDHPYNELIIKELLQSVKWVIKHSGPLIPPMASEAAVKATKDKGIDIFALKWEYQLKAESIIAGRKITARKNVTLFHEHKTPVQDTLIKILDTKGDYLRILDLLMAQEIVWILRTENIKLPHRDRGDHDKAYQQAGIMLIKNRYGIDWLSICAFP